MVFSKNSLNHNYCLFGGTFLETSDWKSPKHKKKFGKKAEIRFDDLILVDRFWALKQVEQRGFLQGFFSSFFLNFR